jgi:hypothetical protein
MKLKGVNINHAFFYDYPAQKYYQLVLVASAKLIFVISISSAEISKEKKNSMMSSISHHTLTLMQTFYIK